MSSRTTQPKSATGTGTAQEAELVTRRAFCHIHHWVEAIVVGSKVKCPKCGAFASAAESLAAQAAAPAKVDGLHETFQRIELAENARAIRTAIERAPPEVRQMVPECPTTLSMVEAFLAVCMTASLADLEKALREIQDRADRLLGLPILLTHISDLEAKHAQLVAATAGLNATKQTLNNEVASLKAHKTQVLESLVNAKKRTGKSIAEILELLRQDTDLQRRVADLVQFEIRIGREIHERSKYLGHLKWQIYYGEEHVRRLQAVDKASLGSLAANLTLKDIQELERLVWQRQEHEAEKRVLERLNPRAGQTRTTSG